MVPQLAVMWPSLGRTETPYHSGKLSPWAQRAGIGPCLGTARRASTAFGQSMGEATAIPETMRGRPQPPMRVAGLTATGSNQGQWLLEGLIRPA
ncbi:MAG: hypothetical protein OXN89_23720 [Bryobacterales bacterium]|nr:hypothetical protein [Bryobacterales bacterium]